MAMLAYLKLKGQKQGDIRGSITQKGRENTIGIIAAKHEIVSPRDPQSGLPIGRRSHKPFFITKEVDKSSPLLYNAMITNENITQWELLFWTPQLKDPTGVGAEVQYYTVKLTNANIASIQFVLPNVSDPDLAKRTEYEEIAFTYQKIEWVWVDGGITAEDDWADRT